MWCYLLCCTSWLFWLHAAEATVAQVISSRTLILRHLLQPQHSTMKPKVEGSLAACSSAATCSTAAAAKAGCSWELQFPLGVSNKIIISNLESSTSPQPPCVKITNLGQVPGAEQDCACMAGGFTQLSCFSPSLPGLSLPVSCRKPSAVVVSASVESLVWMGTAAFLTVTHPSPPPSSSTATVGGRSSQTTRA